ncbi:uncharacterized protein [Amphiura filiformis]|uniref:uncharacterized protein isoform X2 n=1 Tax=Amphiura filiformis TaxID=82378 RepID=UPI003B21EED1
MKTREDGIKSEISQNSKKASKKKAKRKEKKNKRHKKTKTTDVTFSGVLHNCKFCSKFYPSKERLKEHMHETHSNAILNAELDRVHLVQCRRCSKSFSSEEELIRHCDVCKVVTFAQSIPSEVEEKLNLKCTSCNVYFSSEESLRDHEKMHVCHAVATCPCCSSQVRTPNPNVRSMETQTLTFESCDKCSEEFESKTELDWHRLTAHKITPPTVHLSSSKPPGRPRIPKEKLTCTVCGRVFKNVSAVKSHMRAHRGRETRETIQCKDCDITFQEESELKLHMENHQTFACSECGKLFTSLLRLQAHFRWHDQSNDEKSLVTDKTWICHVCGQVYGRKSHLTTHLKRHEGNRSYTCIHCGKGFYTSHNLKIHVWTHTGERPYMCTKEGCFKRFTQKSHLKYHMKTHDKKAASHEGSVAFELITPAANTAVSQRLEDTKQITESGQVPPPGGAILEAEHLNEEEVSTTPHVELQGSASQPPSRSEVLGDIASFEPASIFITEIHSYSEQTIGPKK